MTKSLITLPSERYEEYERQLAEKEAEISEQAAEISRLKELLEKATAENNSSKEY